MSRHNNCLQVGHRAPHLLLLKNMIKNLNYLAYLITLENISFCFFTLRILRLYSLQKLLLLVICTMHLLKLIQKYLVLLFTVNMRI